MASKKIHKKRLLVEIYTNGKMPLELDEHELEQLQEGIDKVVRATVDLRYYPESRYVEEWQEIAGVSVEEG